MTHVIRINQHNPAKFKFITRTHIPQNFRNPLDYRAFDYGFTDNKLEAQAYSLEEIAGAIANVDAYLRKKHPDCIGNYEMEPEALTPQRRTPPPRRTPLTS